MKYEFEIISISLTPIGGLATVRCNDRTETVMVGTAFVNHIKSGDKIIIEIKKA